MPQSPQSVIVYDASGRRASFTDLKDIQERAFPAERFAQVAADCDACVLCNINFARGLLPVAKRLGKLVATDIHTIAEVEDNFNLDFMAAADILFCSDERLPVAPETWVRAVAKRYSPAIQVVGLGSRGALLFERGAEEPCHVPAVQTRPVVNTIGAGDSLFSAFLHAYLASGNAHRALRIANLFASWKVGGNGGADGLLTGAQLAQLVAQHLSD
jgi:ribokinase